MTSAEKLFVAEGERLKKDVEYQTGGFYLDIIENISHALKRAGMNRAELAHAMNVSPGRVTNLMRGYKKNLEIKTIVQVALAVGIQPHELCAQRKTSEMIIPWTSMGRQFRNASVESKKDNLRDDAKVA